MFLSSENADLPEEFSFNSDVVDCFRSIPRYVFLLIEFLGIN